MLWPNLFRPFRPIGLNTKVNSIWPKPRKSPKQLSTH